MNSRFNTLWQWFYRFVVGVGLLFAGFSLLLVFGMSRPNITESDGYVRRSPDAIACTISDTLPETASKIRFLHASVGMGGRLRLYRFAAPNDDLHLHAKSEFDAHWDHPAFTATPNSASPFDPQSIERISKGFGCDATWILPPADGMGTIYESSDGQASHRPLIFVDDANGVLYFLMTD